MPNYDGGGRVAEGRLVACVLFCVVAFAACKVADDGAGAPTTYGLGTPATSADVAALKASGAQLALVMRVEQPYYRTRF